MDEIRTINITTEAKDDFYDICGYEFPNSIKDEINYYLRKKETLQDYFKIKYLDEETDKELYLFFLKGNRFVDMQVYNLCGICETENWSQELEDCGGIRSWLTATYENLQSKDDWVEIWRIQQIEKLKKDLGDAYCEKYYRSKGTFGKLQEIYDAIAEYLSDSSQDWETFAERIRKLTGEDGFANPWYKPTATRRTRNNTLPIQV